jgi:acyl-CoA thioesterase-1
MSIRSASVKNVAQFWLAVLLCLTVCSGVADAKTIKVFALGASNTNGKGVGSDRAWPAQLERILRAKGYDATVTVNAVNGDTSEGVLRRANSIPTGTQVVVFDTGGDNDHLRGRTENDINATKARIVSAIRAHGAVPIQAPYRTLIGPLRSGGAGYQADGHHLTAKSHGRVASFLASKVLAAVR